MAYQEIGKIAITPKGTWNSSLSYLVLDCVSNEDKTAYYIAKKNVPAGTWLTNADYWDVVTDITALTSTLDSHIQKIEDTTVLAYPQKAARGNIIQINDTIEAPLQNITIYGKSVQDGTPSPDSPVTISIAGSGGSIGIVSCGKNLINGDSFNGYTKNGLTCVASGGEVRVSGNAPSATTLLYASKQSLAAGTYIISGGVSSNISVDLRDDNSAQISGAVSTGGDTTFTLTETRNDIWPCIRVAANADVNGLVIRMMVRPVSVSNATFAPYSGSSVALPTPNGLPGIPVSSGGNYTDTNNQQWLCDTIDMEVGTYTKRVGVAVCDGSEDEGWTQSTNLNYMYGFGKPGSSFSHDIGLYDDDTLVAAAAPHMTSWSTGREINSWQGNNVQVGESYISGAARLWIRTNHPTIEEFYAALAANPMTFIFPLATPTTEPLTTEQKTALATLKSQKNYTVVYTTDITNMEMIVNATTNFSPYLESKAYTAYPTKEVTNNIIDIDNTVEAPLQNFIIYGNTNKKYRGFRPTPDSPINIDSVGENGSIDFYSTNGNLFDPDYLLGAVGWQKEGKIYKGNSRDLVLHFQNNRWKPNIVNTGKEITISGRIQFNNLSNGEAISNPRFIIHYKGNSEQIIPITPSLSYFAPIIGTTNSTAIVEYIYFTYDNYETTNVVMSLVDLCISYSNTALNLDYVKLNKINFPVQDALRSIYVDNNILGNYTDIYGDNYICDTINKEEGVYIKRVGKVVWDGSADENWIRQASWSLPGFSIRIPDSAIQTDGSKTPNVICDKLKVISNATQYDSVKTGMLSMDPASPAYHIAIENVTNVDVDAFRVYLSNNPITVLYPLSEPIIIPLTKIQKDTLETLYSQKEHTIIYSTDVLRPELTVKAAIDNQSYLNNKLYEKYPTVSESGDIIDIIGTVNTKLQLSKIYGKTVKSNNTLNNVKATTRLKVVGKNWIPFPNSMAYTNAYGINFNVNTDGTIYISGYNTHATDNANFNIYNANINGFLPNGTYKISGLPTSGIGVEACSLIVKTNNKDNINNNDNTTATYHTVSTNGEIFNCAEHSTIASIFIAVSPSITVKDVKFNLMLVRGEDTDVENYVRGTNANNSININFNSTSLKGLSVPTGGNYIDSNGTHWICDTIDLKAKKKITRIGVLSFSRNNVKSEWFTQAESNATVFYYKLDNLMKAGPNENYSNYKNLIKSNNFNTYADQTALKSKDNSISGYVEDSSHPNENWIYLRVSSEINTTTKLAEYFENNPIEIIYALAEPVIEDFYIGPEISAQLDVLKSQDDYTTIYSIDDVAPDLEVNATIDVPTYINTKIESIEKSINNNNNIDKYLEMIDNNFANLVEGINSNAQLAYIPDSTTDKMSNVVIYASSN